ncbi:MAG: 5-oxoprolinase subunit PxpA [Lachnospiraceae bacterium]|nr:5-oxoprolinase subunit PxpA [Lachnospiraceae bacterium]
MLKVDLNSDLGESFGAYKIGMDADILQYVSSANVACGFHAGDPLVMEETVRLAKKAGAAVGAHPGYPDLQGFGRRNMICTPKEVKVYVKYQLGALLAFTRSARIPLQHCKPHGALYNMAAKDKALAAAIAEAVADVDAGIILLGLAGSAMTEAGKEAGLRVAGEVFADRAYQADGSLVPRSMPGAVIHDTEEALSRTVRMVKEGIVTAVTGETVPLTADSICVHGDNPSALAFVKAIRERLETEGVSVVPLSVIV